VKHVKKFSFVVGLIIGVAAMLIIPSPIGRVAKASTCSAFIGIHGITISGSSTTSGSCSSGGAFATSGGSRGIGGEAIGSFGGSKSSCSSVSSGPHVVSSLQSSGSSNGAVSCSSHSP